MVTNVCGVRMIKRLKFPKLNRHITILHRGYLSAWLGLMELIHYLVAYGFVKSNRLLQVIDGYAGV